MRQEKQMTEQESLLIIQQMIASAKVEQKDDGKGWIIWGWLLFTASVLTVVNMHTNWFQTYFFWNLFGALAILVGVYETIVVIFVKKKVRVKTYTKAIFEKLNIGYFVSLMFIIVGMNVGIRPSLGFPLLMNLYGFWILIYGAILNFKPSMVGAFIMWALAFVAMFIDPIQAWLVVNPSANAETKFFDTYQMVMILHAIGVLCGYIIPGHIANIEFKKVTGRNIT